MNDLTLAAPEPEGSGSGDNASPENTDQEQRKQRRRKSGQVLNKQKCLEGLSHLPSLLATGFIKPPVANSMCGVYRELLSHHQQAERAGAGPTVENADVMALLRADPNILAMIEPFLTDDQLELIMREATDGTGKT
jgi:hypothetical protein